MDRGVSHSQIIYPRHTRIIGFLYRNLLKPVLFKFDPENVHDRMTRFGELLGKRSLARRITSGLLSYASPKLEQNILGIRFINPVGLAAGFDKNAQLVDILPDVGFGFVEVGSITGQPCSGNPRPRLWRLPKLRALVVYYGLKNKGAEILSQELRGRHFRIPVGISAAKTNNQNTVDTQMAIADYGKVLDLFRDIGTYFTINISCPNAYGGEPFTDPKLLDALLTAVDFRVIQKPIFIKLAADLTTQQLDAVIAVAMQHRVDGFICSNLTKKRDKLNLQGMVVPPVGGISGKAVEELSNKQIQHIYRVAGKKFIVIGCGGVFSAEDAYKKIRLGASLIQLITGMVYRGPQLIGEINRGLVQLLERDGYSNISQAIGADNR